MEGNGGWVQGGGEGWYEEVGRGVGMGYGDGYKGVGMEGGYEGEGKVGGDEGVGMRGWG
jgi:hypothetical protein